LTTYLYPNPATSAAATVLCNLCEDGTGQIYVYNTAAELLATVPFAGKRGANRISLALGTFAHGVYYYIVRVDGPSGKHRSKPTAFAVARS
jgi:hypothetical protein